jgi:FADH2 O2-dependent halogenase
MPLTLLGVERLARALESGGIADVPAWAPADYARVTLAEADHTARFIAGCYAAFPRFEQFTAFSMFYFAAASFSEMARRLDRPSPGFLFAADARFRADMARLSPVAHAPPIEERDVAAALDRLNVAGLSDRAKRNWYGVDLEDAVRGAEKLGVSANAVREMLAAQQASVPGAQAQG